MADADACWPKVVILGHTLVCRLAKDLNDGFDERAVDNFNLAKTKVHMYGVEGRKIGDLCSHDLGIVAKVKPDVVILDVGSYDLVTSAVEIVGSAIVTLINLLLQDFDVQVVGVCLAIPCPSLQKVEPAFLAKTKALNQHIKTSNSSAADKVFCWSHRGLFQPTNPVYEPDGVYLNKVGQFNLYRSYRGAVIQALQVLQNLHPSTTGEQPTSPNAVKLEETPSTLKRSSSPLNAEEAPASRRRRSESPITIAAETGGNVSPVTTLSSQGMEQIVQQVTDKVTQAVMASLQQALPTTTSIVPWGGATSGATSSTKEDASESKSQFNSQPGIPIGSCLPADVKTKIWNDEYVDFGLLLVSHPGEFTMQYHVSVNDDPENPSLSLQSNYKALPVPSIEVWTSAFHVFVGVYTLKHPSQAPMLMKYAETVRNLASHGWNWKYYDQNFRRLRQTDPQMFSWGDIHWELWLFAQSKPQEQKEIPEEQKTEPQEEQATNSAVVENQNSAAEQDTNEKPLFVPPGFCFKHHRGLGCKLHRQCPYRHTCPRCHGKHRLVTCIILRQEMARQDMNMHMY